MRHSRNTLLVATTLVALSTLAQAQQCPTLPPVEVTQALPAPSGAPDTGPVLRPTPTVPTPRLLPAAEIAASPALRRITSTGAKVYEIGNRAMNHGLQGVYAVNGDIFRVPVGYFHGWEALLLLLWLGDIYSLAQQPMSLNPLRLRTRT